MAGIGTSKVIIDVDLDQHGLGVSQAQGIWQSCCLVEVLKSGQKVKAGRHWVRGLCHLMIELSGRDLLIT